MRSVAASVATSVAAAVAAALGLAVVAAACGDDAPERTEAGYCTEVTKRLAELNTPSISAPEDVTAVLAAWREVAARAPLAVEEDWAVVVAGMETAATVDPGDPESVQRMADTARAGEPAATRVIVYTYQKCNATIGGVPPVTTTPAQVPPPTDG